MGEQHRIGDDEHQHDRDFSCFKQDLTDVLVKRDQCKRLSHFWQVIGKQAAKTGVAVFRHP